MWTYFSMFGMIQVRPHTHMHTHRVHHHQNAIGQGMWLEKKESAVQNGVFNSSKTVKGFWVHP